MATILEFRVAENDGGRKDTPVESGLGEIIIFPGVRIERHGAHEQALPSLDEETRAGVRTTSQA